MAMTPSALSLLGVQPTPQRRRRQDPTEVLAAEMSREVVQLPEPRPVRSSRKATSYCNVFQTVCSPATDDPPTYDVAARQRTPQRSSPRPRESLPSYTCSVEKSAKVLIQLEATNPMHDPTESEWREAFLVLRGTLLSFHRVKDNGPGKLLRSYTLQHAEVGLALDTEHSVLVPQTRLARLVPTSARRKAMLKDPDMFKVVRQHVLRLRAETDQIVVAHDAEEDIHKWIHAISAGIDIAHDIDERSLPRLCTVPRRRRRQRASQTGDITDPAVVAEQERILQEMYPGFARPTAEVQAQPDRPVSTASRSSNDGPQTASREEDELDLAAIREDAGSNDEPSSRPPMTRNTTSDSVNSTYSTDMMYATLPANFDIDGKWQPQHSRTPHQIQRYIRRCMPVLSAQAVRASDVLIINGHRVKINWHTELLEQWELQPPTYKSHHFESDSELESRSQHSITAQDQDNPNTSSSDLGVESDDLITRAGERPTTLDLSKSAVLSAMDKRSSQRQSSLSDGKQQQRQQTGQDIHGVVFCF